MANWQKFEDECTNYLNSEYKNETVSFSSTGGTNSGNCDIEVRNNDSKIFNIEVKLSPCQSGQFVVIDKNNSFEISARNKFYNKYSNKIIEYLNQDYNTFSEIKQSGVDVNLQSSDLFNWIKEHYKEKNSLFVITSEELNSYKAIIGIDDIENYFQVSACLRRKKSGTRYVPKLEFSKAIESLKTYKYKIINSIEFGGKLFVEVGSKEEIIPKKERNVGVNYFLSPDDKRGWYTLKKKSNTNNINVIFSLNYTGPKNNFGIEDLTKNILEKRNSANL